MEELQLEDGILTPLHGLPQVHQEERPEGIHVGSEDLGLVELVPVEVVQLVHELDAEAGQLKDAGDGQGGVWGGAWIGGEVGILVSNLSVI